MPLTKLLIVQIASFIASKTVFLIVKVPDQTGEGDYAEDDLDGVSGLPDGLALFRKNLDEPLLNICRLLGPNRFLASVCLINPLSSPTSDVSEYYVPGRKRTSAPSSL